MVVTLTLYAKGCSSVAVVAAGIGAEPIALGTATSRCMADIG